MSTCKSCGAEIIWARTTKGHMMPLNATPAKVITLDQSIRGEPPVAHIGNGYTSHFSTCPDADDWRRREELQT